jgi:hypothetical protein
VTGRWYCVHALQRFNCVGGFFLLLVK